MLIFLLNLPLLFLEIFFFSLSFLTLTGRFIFVVTDVPGFVVFPGAVVTSPAPVVLPGAVVASPVPVVIPGFVVSPFPVVAGLLVAGISVVPLGFVVTSPVLSVVSPGFVVTSPGLSVVSPGFVVGFDVSAGFVVAGCEFLNFA